MNNVKCLLGIDPAHAEKCNPQECPHCGWNESVAARREEHIKEHGLTLCKDGLRRLVMKSSERDGGKR